MDISIKPFDLSRLSGKSMFDPKKVGYSDSVSIIEDELQNTRKSFIKIGWYLKHIDDEKMYIQDGYTDIFDFAYAKFKMAPETVNRFINVCIAFSVNHDSPELDEQYAEFKVSQLFEMLPMKEEERKEISSDMTVKQIREKKAEQKAAKEPSDESVVNFLKLVKNYRGVAHLDDFGTISDLKDYLVDIYGKSHCEGGPDPDFQCSPRGIKLDNCEEITWLAFAKRAWNLNTSESPSVVPMKEKTEEAVLETDYLSEDVADTEILESLVPDEKRSEILSDKDYKALLKEANELSEKIYKGIRFSTQNNTMSQIEEYIIWTTKLNNIINTIYEDLRLRFQ